MAWYDVKLFRAIADLFRRKEPPTTDTQFQAVARELQRAMSLHARATNVETAIYQAFAPIYNQLTNYVRALSQLESFYVVPAVVQVVRDEALAPSPITGNVIDVFVSKDYGPPVQEAVAQLNGMGLDALVSDLIDDVIKVGSVAFKVLVKEGEGVQDVFTGYYPVAVRALKGSKPVAYVVGDGQQLLNLEPANSTVAIFLNPKRVSLQQGSLYGFGLPPDLTTAAFQHGRGLFYGFVDKVLDLYIAEALTNARQVADVKRASIVGVSAPSTMTRTEQIQDLIRTYEEALNEDIDTTPSSSVMANFQSLRNYLSKAGRIKVLPLLGEKGDVRPLEIRSGSAADELALVQDKRRTLCSALGVPYDLVFAFEAGEERVAVQARRYYRFSRLVRRVQTSISTALTDLALLHLRARGHEVPPEAVKVIFAQSPVLADLDSLDALLFSVDYMQNLLQFIQDLRAFAAEAGDEETAARVDPNGVLDFVARHLAAIPGAQGLIKMEEGATTRTENIVETLEKQGYRHAFGLNPTVKVNGHG